MKPTWHITREFGVYDPAYANYPDSKHPGTDYAVKENTPLPAYISGTIEIFDRNEGKTGRGKEVRIVSGDTNIRYCHMNRIDVKWGDKITAGQIIGLSGNTGYSSGPHLHFEVLINGVYTNPKLWEGEAMSVVNDGDTHNHFVAGWRRKPTQAELDKNRGKEWNNGAPLYKDVLNQLNWLWSEVDRLKKASDFVEVKEKLFKKKG